MPSGIVGRNFQINGFKVNEALVPTDESFTFTGLTPSTSYSITATNVDGAGNESAPSAPLLVTTAGLTVFVDPLPTADQNAIDSIVAAAMTVGGAPGVQVAVTSPKGAYYKAYGSSGVAPLTIVDHFRMGSITKSFTATAVLMQVDQGHLALGDTLGQYVTGVPNGDLITIEQMLMMRSGVYNYENSMLGFPFQVISYWPFSEPDQLALIRSNPSQFTPGTAYQYTNSNYVLLGAVVEAITGRSIRDVLIQDIITPLGLSETTWPRGPDGVAQNNAVPLPAARNDPLNPEWYGAAGALTSTIDDLQKWGQYLRVESLLSPESHTARMNTFHSVPYQFEGPTEMGYGLGVENLGSWFGHTGSLPGFGAVCMFHPSTGSVITVMENLQTAHMVAFSNIFYKIADYLYPDSAKLRNAATQQFAVLSSIPSEEAFGSIGAALSNTVLPSSIPSSEAFGTLTATRSRIDATFDNASAISTTGTDIPAFTIAPTATAVVAWVSAQTSSNLASASATIGGVPMAKTVIGTGNYKLVLFKLLNPPTGNQSITLSGFAATGAYFAAAAASYKNVSGFGTAVTAASDSSTPATMSASSSVGDLVVNGFMHTGTRNTYSQTMRGSKAPASFVNQGLVFGDAPGAATVSFDASFTGPVSWRGISIPLLAASSGDPAPLGIPGTWTLTFQDDFNGTTLDRTKWSDCWFSPGSTMNNVGTFPANLSVSGGNLILTLASNTSGALVSTNPHGGTNGASVGYQFNQGVVEARISFPGDGSTLYNWPAFWTDGQSWPADGEHDIAEVLSAGAMTVNYHSSSGAHNQGSVPGYWGDTFHTFALHRKAGSADVYYDGVLVKSYSTDDNGNPQYIIINVGESSGSHHAYGTTSQVKIDYVRAWR